MLEQLQKLKNPGDYDEEILRMFGIAFAGPENDFVMNNNVAALTALGALFVANIKDAVASGPLDAGFISNEMLRLMISAQEIKDALSCKAMGHSLELSEDEVEIFKARFVEGLFKRFSHKEFVINFCENLGAMLEDEFKLATDTDRMPASMDDAAFIATTINRLNVADERIKQQQEMMKWLKPEWFEGGAVNQQPISKVRSTSFNIVKKLFVDSKINKADSLGIVRSVRACHADAEVDAVNQGLIARFYFAPSEVHASSFEQIEEAVKMTCDSLSRLLLDMGKPEEDRNGQERIQAGYSNLEFLSQTVNTAILDLIKNKKAIEYFLQSLTVDEGALTGINNEITDILKQYGSLYKTIERDIAMFEEIFIQLNAGESKRDILALFRHVDEQYLAKIGAAKENFSMLMKECTWQLGEGSGEFDVALNDLGLCTANDRNQRVDEKQVQDRVTQVARLHAMRQKNFASIVGQIEAVCNKLDEIILQIDAFIRLHAEYRDVPVYQFLCQHLERRRVDTADRIDALIAQEEAIQKLMQVEKKLVDYVFKDFPQQVSEEKKAGAKGITTSCNFFQPVIGSLGKSPMGNATTSPVMGRELPVNNSGRIM